MKKYFEVTVAIVVATLKNGKDKINKEVYLVDSLSVTEAEAKVVAYFSNVNLDYKVISAKESRVHEVI